MPRLVPPFSSAMHGLGTDEANLIRVLATKTNDQVIALNKRYSYRYGHKGDLLKWIAGARVPLCPLRFVCAPPR